MAPLGAVDTVIVTDPIPWRDVPEGAQVMIGGVPRTVSMNVALYPGRPGDSRVVLVEGWVMPPTVGGLGTVRMAIMDTVDAVATLAAAGLDPEIIETNEGQQ